MRTPTAQEIEAATAWATPIGGAYIDRETIPHEGYSFTTGAVTQSATPTPVKTTTGFIAITGWEGATYTRTLTSDDRKDIFVTYTNKENAADTDFLHFGYWYNLSPQTETVPDAINLIARGAAESGSVESVTGTASYSGPATGLYAKKAGGVYTEHGQFTASVSLQAAFTSDESNSVSGSVTDFRDKDGNAIDSSWTVTLNAATHSPKETESTVYVGGTTSGGGQWRFQYFGPVEDSAGEPIAPSGIAGSFKTDFTNGKVAGAFAATKN